MPWKKSAGVAQYSEANWDNFIKREPNCTPEEARRIAFRDPEISFYFICNGYMALENNAAPYSPFNPGDAIFFKGEPWFGTAPQCDSYVKESMNVAVLNNPNPEEFDSTPTYKMASGEPAVDVCIIFAANCCLEHDILPGYKRLAPNTNVPADQPVLVGNPSSLEVLPKIKELQDQGLNVLLSVLSLVWQQFPNTDTGKANAEIFVAQLKECVEHYGLDGIDIDNEGKNANFDPHYTSITMIASLYKKALPGKIISKELWYRHDDNFFDKHKGSWEGQTLAECLSYGWEMTYSLAASTALPNYVAFGMAKNTLSKGYWYTQSKDLDLKQNVKWLKDNDYGGIMVYGFGEPNNDKMMGELVDYWYGPGNWNQS